MPRFQRWSALRATTAVGYCRRSTDRQEQSIPDQRTAIEKYARERGLKLQRFYIDDAISGSSSIGRKAFQQLIGDATRPSCDFGHVAVYDIKRFGRVDNDEAGYYRHILKTHGVEVLYCSENFTGDRTDDLLRPVKQWQAREESKDLSKVTIRGLLSRVHAPRPGDPSNRPAGWWIGGVPPFGYDLRYESFGGEFLFYLRYQPNCTKQMFNEQWKLIRTLAKGESVKAVRNDRAKLVPSDLVRVKLVQRIFQMFVNERRGFKSIAQKLNAESVPTIRTGEWCPGYRDLWGSTTVGSILKNPVYAGDLVWNRRSDGRFHRIVRGVAVELREVKQVRLSFNDEADWIIVRNAHQAFISRRIWAAARELLKKKPESRRQLGVNPRTGSAAGYQPRMQGSAWVEPRVRFLLSGLIICQRCGCRYEGRANYGKRSINGLGPRERTYVYGCGGYIRYGTRVCVLGAVPQIPIEEAVAKTVLEFYSRYAGANGKQRVGEALRVHANRSIVELHRHRKRLEASLRRVDRTVRNLLDNITPTNRDMADCRLVQLRQQREDDCRALARLEHTALSKMEVEETIDVTVAFVMGLQSVLTNATPEQRKAALRRCISRISIGSSDLGAITKLRLLPCVGIPSPDTPTESVCITWR